MHSISCLLQWFRYFETDFLYIYEWNMSDVNHSCPWSLLFVCLCPTHTYQDHIAWVPPTETSPAALAVLRHHVQVGKTGLPNGQRHAASLRSPENQYPLAFIQGRWCAIYKYSTPNYFIADIVMWNVRDTSCLGKTMLTIHRLIFKKYWTGLTFKIVCPAIFRGDWKMTNSTAQENRSA